MEFTEQVIEENYIKFINLLKNNVKREGIDTLIQWLNAKDTKTAPASTRFHMSCKGGLVKHCLNVYNRLKRLMAMEYNENCPYSEETLTIVALLHDISKINFYEVSYRNTKDENGSWIKVPFYQIKEDKDRLIFGSHSMNSYYMVSKFLKLNYEEELAILHHMGGTDPSEDTITIKNVYTAFERSALATLLHVADVMATVIDEVEVE